MEIVIYFLNSTETKFENIEQFSKGYPFIRFEQNETCFTFNLDNIAGYSLSNEND